MTRDAAMTFAAEWAVAWNARDIERVLGSFRSFSRRGRMKVLWLPVATTCVVGVSCGLPLFLYMREQEVD
jgi:hypothetical protein